MPVSGAWTYTLSGSDATITAYDIGTYGTDVTVPETLDGYPVVAVAYAALYGYGLTSVTINHDVALNQFSFGYLSSASIALRSLTVYINVDLSYTNYPFDGRYFGSNSIIYAEGVTKVTTNCFNSAETQIDEIVFPSTLTTIENNAFAHSYDTTMTVDTYTIPTQITYIGQNAFQNLNINSVIVNHECTLVGSFPYCGITSVTIGANIYCGSTLGCFGNNDLADGVTINNTVTQLKYGVLSNSGLTEIVLPSSVIQLDARSLANNPNLSSVTIGALETVTFASNVLEDNTPSPRGTIYGYDSSVETWAEDWIAYYDYMGLTPPTPHAISRVVITPEYGFQIDRWNQLLNGGNGDWGNVVYIGTEGQFHIDNGYLDMRKSVATCTDIVEQNRILIDPAIGIKIQKNIATNPTTPDWFDVFYVDEEGDIKLADENGNGIILDQFGMDTKFIKWFKNMCYNSSFEVYDTTTYTPTYWSGDGVVSGDSSWFGDVSCKLEPADYIQTDPSYAINPNFYDNVVPDTNLTRISFHKKLGEVKVEVLDLDNSSQAYTLTDTNGNTGSYLTFVYNANYIPESYSFNFDHFEFGPTTQFVLKFTNTDTTYDAYLDAVIIEPDFTRRRPSFYTDGPKSLSTTVLGDIGAQIVVDTTAPTDTTKLWLDIN